MLVYKIGNKNYVKTLSASGIDGRWGSGGRSLIYCAESIALAVLENLVRRQGTGFNDDYKTLVIDIPDALGIEVIRADELPKGWNNFRDYSLCQQYGNRWYDEMQKPVLKVPSAVLPESSNYVLNARHPDFPKITLLLTADFVPDERIEDLLKHYRV